jgi:hypothetical protein
MRTTLTLDGDVVALLREEAHRSKRPFKQVVNQAIPLERRPSNRGGVAVIDKPSGAGEPPGGRVRPEVRGCGRRRGVRRWS